MDLEFYGHPFSLWYFSIVLESSSKSKNFVSDPSLHCNVTGLICLIDHYSNYSILVNSWSQSGGLYCDCLPSCSEPEYDLVEAVDTGYVLFITYSQSTLPLVFTWHFSFSSGEDFAIVEYSLQRLPSLRFKRTVTRDTLDLVGKSSRGCHGGRISRAFRSLHNVVHQTKFRSGKLF